MRSLCAETAAGCYLGDAVQAGLRMTFRILGNHNPGDRRCRRDLRRHRADLRFCSAFLVLSISNRGVNLFFSRTAQGERHVASFSPLRFYNERDFVNRFWSVSRSPPVVMENWTSRTA